MKIRITVSHEDEETRYSEHYEMPIEEFDHVVKPEDIIKHKIWEMRNNITNQIISKDKIDRNANR